MSSDLPAMLEATSCAQLAPLLADLLDSRRLPPCAASLVALSDTLDLCCSQKPGDETALYRIVQPGGAVLRSTSDTRSRSRGVLPAGTLVIVTKRRAAALTKRRRRTRLPKKGTDPPPPASPPRQRLRIVKVSDNFVTSGWISSAAKKSGGAVIAEPHPGFALKSGGALAAVLAAENAAAGYVSPAKLSRLLAMLSALRRAEHKAHAYGEQYFGVDSPARRRAPEAWSHAAVSPATARKQDRRALAKEEDGCAVGQRVLNEAFDLAADAASDDGAHDAASDDGGNDIGNDTDNVAVERPVGVAVPEEADAAAASTPPTIPPACDAAFELDGRDDASLASDASPPAPPVPESFVLLHNVYADEACAVEEPMPPPPSARGERLSTSTFDMAFDVRDDADSETLDEGVADLPDQGLPQEHAKAAKPAASESPTSVLHFAPDERPLRPERAFFSRPALAGRG